MHPITNNLINFILYLGFKPHDLYVKLFDILLTDTMCRFELDQLCDCG